MWYHNFKHKVKENYNTYPLTKEHFIFHILIVIPVTFCMCNYALMYTLSENSYNSYSNLINKKIGLPHDLPVRILHVYLYC